MTMPTHTRLHEEFDAAQDVALSPADEPTFGEVVQRRLGRRDVLRGVLTGTALAAVGVSALPVRALAVGASGGARFNYTDLKLGVDQKHHVAAGHNADILIRWGDPIFADAPDFDAYKQTAASQRRQFGYNCDYTGFLPVPGDKSLNARGLLFVNHEYTQRDMMFPDFVPKGRDRLDDRELAERYTKDIAEIEMAAHGASVVEVAKGPDGKWQAVRNGRFNRRITADTPMTLTGPAAGHARLRTNADAGARTVLGTINNCAGGITPWGTFLTCEENIDGYFMGTLPSGHPEQGNHDRMGIPGNWYQWGRYDARWDVSKDPNEPNRFGWVVEVDPNDPASTPRKHTALGRFKHEGAGITLNKDGRVVVYMGDDQRFEHIYRFVSKGRFDPKNRRANLELLTEGTLSVARFDDDGRLTWLPMVYGRGPLTADAGFRDQGDVVIQARLAATLLGATRMDRPEAVEVNPLTGKVYAMLTNNESRRPADPARYGKLVATNSANPRPENLWGHIVEMIPPGGDHAAETFGWELLLKAGDPSDPAIGARYNPAAGPNGWMACPDACTVDSLGRLWVATDQGSGWKRASGIADGLYGVETEGPLRGMPKPLFRVPVGAECTGPSFTPDATTLFVAVQHPGSDGVEDFLTVGQRATFQDPGTRWPDFNPKTPPRPSVVVITRKGGGVVGA